MSTKLRKKPKKLRSARSSSYVFIAGCLALLAAGLMVAAKPATSAVKTEEGPIRIVNEDDIVLVQTPARPVARGEKLASIPIATMKWPKSRLSAEYISDLSQHKDAVALTPLPKFLPIPLSAITSSPLDNNQVTESIPQGMRAITVRVDAESAVEGWAQSGNFVDVLMVRAGKESEGGLETRLIAENIKILSAGRSAEPSAGEQMAPKPPSTVTLLTSQEDALKIKTAANLGKLTFALRGIADNSPAERTSINQRAVIDGAKPVEPRKRYRGKATGPDGKNYVLYDNSTWEPSAQRSKPIEIQDEPPEASAAGANRGPEVGTK